MDMNRLKFAVILTGLPVFVMIISIITNAMLSKKHKLNDYIKQFQSSFDWVNFAILSSALFLLNFTFFPLLQAQEKSQIESTSIGIAFIILLVGLSPILFPLIVLIRTSKYEVDDELELLVNKEMNTTIKIRVINQNVVNAFATGVLPFTNIILIGAPLLKQFTSEELKAIIAHEIGHTIKRHMLYLTLLMILIQISLLLLHQYVVLPLILLNKLNWIFKGVSFGILFVLGNEIFSFFQKKTEYSADKFAAETVGINNYAEVLKKLNTVTGGQLQNKTATHPTLIERLEYIKS